MAQPILRGVFTALVTPFRADGSIDRDALTRLVQRQLAGGVQGLVPCGTTGETPAFEEHEWDEVVGLTIELARGTALVVPGTGTNNTRHSIARTRRAKELGADAALVVTPYYNKPNPDGLVAHFRAIANGAGLPLVLYNVPGRTGQNVPPELVLRVAAEVPGVIAVKEASGHLAQAQTIIAGRRPGFAVLSGEDELTCAMTLMGGDGVISVVSNVDPAGTVRLVNAALAGDAPAARAEHYRQQALIRALFAETNPVPAKAALAQLGQCNDVVRPPLAAASGATRETLRAALRAAGLA
jgi:4-hydroxy-tetrahydrodipicolinate synthase